MGENRAGTIFAEAQAEIASKTQVTTVSDYRIGRTIVGYHEFEHVRS